MKSNDKNMTKFTQSYCDMCDGSPCAMICKQKHHIIYLRKRYKKRTKTKICGTKLSVKCHMSFSLTYKHCCVVHSHRVQGSSNTLIADNTYQSHFKKFLNDSTEKSKNNSKFWNDPYNVSKHY